MLVTDMNIANILVAHLAKFLDKFCRIHLVVYDNDYYPDFIGKLSELPGYRLYDSIYNCRVDRIFYSPGDTEYLYIYVALNE